MYHFLDPHDVSLVFPCPNQQKLSSSYISRKTTVIFCIFFGQQTYILLAFHSLTIFRNCKYIAVLKSLKTEKRAIELYFLLGTLDFIKHNFSLGGTRCVFNKHIQCFSSYEGKDKETLTCSGVSVSVFYLKLISVFRAFSSFY